MKTKKRKIIGTISFLTFLIINVSMSYENGNNQLIFKNLTRQAYAESESGNGEDACVDVEYFSEHMTECNLPGLSCYNEFQEKCGFERCCEYTSFTSDCNEFTCKSY